MKGRILFSSADLTSAQRARLRQQVSAGHMVKVHRGYYEQASHWASLFPSDKYRLRATAFGSSLTSGALTGASAAAMLGLPIRLDNETQLAMVGKTKSHSSADTIHRVAWSQGEQALVRSIDTAGFTVPVTATPYCLAELARSLSVEEAVVAMDHCLRNKLVSPHELADLPALYARKPHAGKVAMAVDLAEPLTESPMETRLRLAMLRAGLSNFLIQPEIVLYNIVRFIRPDFFFPSHQLIVEYDGQGKYEDSTSAAFDDMTRMHAAANCGFMFLRVNKESLASGAWLFDLRRILSRPPVPQHPDAEVIGGHLCVNRWVTAA